jgi:hypothetical protein
LIQALPGRTRMFTTLGVEALELTELTERPLDELHTIVATTWSARFSADAGDAEPLVLPAHFLLRRHGSSWQIVAYLDSTDLAAVFAERTSRRQERPDGDSPAGGREGAEPCPDEPMRRHEPEPGEIAGPSGAAAADHHP